MKIFALNQTQLSLIEMACKEVNSITGDPKYIRDPRIWKTMDDFSMVLNKKGENVPCLVIDHRKPLSFGSIVGQLHEFPQTRYQTIRKILELKGYVPTVKPIWIESFDEDGPVIESAHGFFFYREHDFPFSPIFSGRVDKKIHIHSTHLMPGNWGRSKDTKDLFYLPFHVESDVISKV